MVYLLWAAHTSVCCACVCVCVCGCVCVWCICKGPSGSMCVHTHTTKDQMLAAITTWWWKITLRPYSDPVPTTHFAQVVMFTAQHLQDGLVLIMFTLTMEVCLGTLIWLLQKTSHKLCLVAI